MSNEAKHYVVNVTTIQQVLVRHAKSEDEAILLAELEVPLSLQDSITHAVAEEVDDEGAADAEEWVDEVVDAQP